MPPVEIFTPVAFSELDRVANTVLNGRTVVVNLLAAPQEGRQRIIDFLSGITFASGGTMEPLTDGFLTLRPKAPRERVAWA